MKSSKGCKTWNVQQNRKKKRHMKAEITPELNTLSLHFGGLLLPEGQVRLGEHYLGNRTWFWGH